MERLVAFDLDDTLVAEALFLRSGIRHMARLLGERFPQLPPLRVVNRMDAAVMRHTNHYSALESLLAETELRESVDMAEIVAEFRNHRPDPEIYHLPPSMRKRLDDLAVAGTRMALITDGRSLTQRNKIEAAGLARYFDPDDILISEETGHDKKDPDNFLFLMRKYAGTGHFVYVADNPSKDFIHPSRLGWETRLAPPFPLAIHQGMPG